MPEQSEPGIYVHPRPSEPSREDMIVERKGNQAIRKELERIRDYYESLGWKHIVGGRYSANHELVKSGDVKAGEEFEERHIPGPGRAWKADSRQGGHFTDPTFETPSGRIVHIQSVDVDKNGKPTERELNAAERIRRAEEDTYIYLIPKNEQLKRNMRFEGRRQKSTVLFMGYCYRQETFCRRKVVVLTERDELAFSRAILEFCPGVVFIGRSLEDGEDKFSSLPSIAHDRDPETGICLPAPGQEKRWQINIDMGCWIVRPHVRFRIRRSKWEWLDPSKKWSLDLPLLGWAELVVGHPRDDEELKKFASKLLRLVNKVSRKGGGFGLNACLWSQAGGDERRGLAGGKLIDPSEKIEPPARIRHAKA